MPFILCFFFFPAFPLCPFWASTHWEVTSRFSLAPQTPPCDPASPSWIVCWPHRICRAISPASAPQKRLAHANERSQEATVQAEIVRWRYRNRGVGLVHARKKRRGVANAARDRQARSCVEKWNSWVNGYCQCFESYPLRPICLASKRNAKGDGGRWGERGQMRSRLRVSIRTLIFFWQFVFLVFFPLWALHLLYFFTQSLYKNYVVQKHNNLPCPCPYICNPDVFLVG